MSVELTLWVGRDVALQRLYRRYYFGKLSYPNRIVCRNPIYRVFKELSFQSRSFLQGIFSSSQIVDYHVVNSYGDRIK